MDIFNRKRVKELETKIAELEKELDCANNLSRTLYVSKGEALPLIAAVHMSERDREIPMSFIQRQLCEKLVQEMFERELVRYEVSDDPRTMSHIIHARIDVVNRG